MTDPAGLSESPATVGTADLVARSCPPEHGWQITEDETWVSAKQASANLPPQGWKLHVSASMEQGTVVLQAVLDVLAGEAVWFKVAGSVEVLAMINSAGGGRSQVGKFVTVYPGSDEQAVRLAVSLDEATRGMTGPRVPSDRRLRPDGIVSYRYGAFEVQWLQTAIGEIVPALQMPDGTLVPDRRSRLYSAPTWVEDPFEARGVVTGTPPASLVVHDRYLLTSVLNSTPEGSVHLAIDLVTGNRCVVKRARGDAGSYSGVGKEDRLAYEAKLLHELADEPAVPDLVERFEADGDHYLVMEHIAGGTVEQLVYDAAAEGRYLGFDQIVVHAREVSAVLERLHRRGFAYGDLKPPHLVAHDHGLHVVDIESLRTADDQILHEVLGTPGYASPQRWKGERLCPADDIYSFGALLYFLITATDPSHSPDRHQVLSRPLELLRPGCPASLERLVRRCLDPSPAGRPPSMEDIGRQLEQVTLTSPQEPRERSTSGPPTTFCERAREVPLTSPEEQSSSELPTNSLKIAHDLAIDLCDAAEETPLWHDTRDGQPVRRDLNTGVAGIVLTLSEVATIFDEDRLWAILESGAHWLARSEPLPGGPLPGLYVGEAGIAGALASAAGMLGDPQLAALARDRGARVGPLPHVSPDLYNGTAGRVRYHLLTWQATGDAVDRSHALDAAAELMHRAVLPPDGTVRWPIPAGHEGPDPREYFGYAHGLSGVGDVLVDVVAMTGDRRYVPLIEAALRSLSRTAVTTLGDGSGLGWTDEPDGNLMQPLWCHGAGGIARFLRRAGHLLDDEEALTLASRARRAIAAARMVGPTQCHGLAGSIDVLLDATEDSASSAAAGELGTLLEAFTRPPDDLEPPSPLALRDHGLMTGRAGVMRSFARLAKPDSLGPLLVPQPKEPATR